MLRHKIAFLFLTISQITNETAWTDFLKGHEEKYSVYIHAKETFNADSPLKKYEMQEKVPTTWEHTMEAQIAMLKKALEDPSNQKFIFLSGDSLPIQSFNFIYSRLTLPTTNQYSFINHWWNHHQDPCSQFYYKERILHGIPEDKQFINPQWVILNREHATKMVHDTAIITIIKRYPCDNEHYPSTFLAMSGNLNVNEVINQPTTFVLWNPGASHPFIFNNLQDPYQRDLLINAINKGLFFARKFDKSCDMKDFQELVQKYAS